MTWTDRSDKRRVFRQLGVLCGAVTLPALLLSGCGTTVVSSTTTTRKPVQITLAMWLGPQGQTMVQQDITAFEKQNPGVKVNLESLSWQAYNTKITTELVGGVGPDVVEIPYESWIYSGFVKNLSPFLQSDPHFQLGNYFSATSNYSRYNGKRFGVGNVYGLPWRAFVTAIYYNKNLFQKYHVPFPQAGWTYSQMLADARKLTHLGSSLTNSVLGLWWFISKSQTGYDPVIWSYGGHEFNAHRTKLTLNSPQSEAGLQWLWDAMYKWKVMANPIQATSGFDFTAGNVAMAELHNAYIPSYRQIIGNQFQWGIAPMPMGPGGIAGSRMFAQTLGIAKTSPHPNTAWKLLTFLVGKQSENALVSEGSLPALKYAAAVYAKQTGGPSGVNIFYQDLQTSRAAAMFNHDHSVENIINSELSLVWLNKESVSQAVNKITAQVDQAMKAHVQ